MKTLFHDLARHGDRPALLDARTGGRVTYGELLEQADALGASVPDGVTFLEIDNHVDPLAAYVGAVRAGRPVLLLPPGGIDKAPHLVDRFRPARLWRSHEGRLDVEDRDDAAPVHPDLAVLLSTSGSTGSPKLVRLSHRNVRSNSDAIVEYLALAEGERAITGLKPNYSYGMSIVNSHLDQGHALILTSASVTEPAFWEAFEAHEATSLAGVPFTYQTLHQLGSDPTRFPHLRYATQAGGKLGADLVAHFAETFAAAGKRFYVMYGQTEAAPRISWLPPELAARHPRSIGRPVPGGRIEIVDDAGQTIEAPDVPGILRYRGPNVMMGYAEDAEALAAGAGDDTLLTGDIAARNADGLYYIVGRAKRFIKPFGTRVNLDEVEQKLQALAPGVVATGNDEVLLIAVEPRHAEAHGALRAWAVDELGLPPHALRLEPVDEIPRLTSGKPDYKALLAGLEPPVDDRPTWRRFLGYFVEELADILGLRERSFSGVAELYQVLIGVAEVRPDHTFSDLGDSMSYVQVRIELEQLLGRLPDAWERQTVAELEAMRSRGAV